VLIPPKIAVSRAGLSTSPAAVPPSERDPSAWFCTPQLHELVPENMPFLGDIPPEIAKAWPASRTRFQQALACVQQLTKHQVDGGHADLSNREALSMRRVSEHLLYLIRRQHAAMFAAVGLSGQLKALHDGILDMPSLQEDSSEACVAQTLSHSRCVSVRPTKC
jgi:midasin